MLCMTDETKKLLREHCPDISTDREHLNDVLDFLDDLMLDSLDENYNPTEDTRPIMRAYDDLYANND